MCEPRPGPRCGAHASRKLAAARLRLDDAELRVSQSHQETTLPSESSGTHDVLRMLDEARNLFQEALREYEATPDGMTALEAAASRCHAAGDDAAVRRIEERLHEVRSVRARQQHHVHVLRDELAMTRNVSVEDRMVLRDAYVAYAEADIESVRLCSRWDYLLNEQDRLERLPESLETSEARMACAAELKTTVVEARRMLESKTTLEDVWRTVRQDVYQAMIRSTIVAEH